MNPFHFTEAGAAAFHEQLAISADIEHCQATRRLANNPALVDAVTETLARFGVLDYLFEVGEGRRKIAFAAVPDVTAMDFVNPLPQLMAHPPRHVVSLMPVSEYLASREVPDYAAHTLPDAAAVLVNEDGSFRAVDAAHPVVYDPERDACQMIITVGPYVVESNRLTRAGLSVERIAAIDRAFGKHIYGTVYGHGDGGYAQWGLAPDDIERAKADPDYIPPCYIYDLGDTVYRGKPSGQERERVIAERKAAFPVYEAETPEAAFAVVRQAVGVDQRPDLSAISNATVKKVRGEQLGGQGAQL